MDFKSRIDNLLAEAKKLQAKDEQTALEKLYQIRSEAEAANDANILAQVIMEISYIHLFNEDFKQSDDLCNQALTVLKKANLNQAVIKTGNRYAFINYRKRHFENALKFYNQSIEFARKVSNDEAVAGTIGNLGMVYTAMSKFSESREKYEESLAMQLELNNIGGIARSYNGLALIDYNLGNYEQALELYLKACEYSLQTNNIVQKARIYNNIASIYNMLNQHDNAIEYYQKSIEMKQRIDDQIGVAVTLNNLGTVFKKKGEFEKALAIYKKALKINKEHNCKVELSNNLNNIGNLFLEMQSYDEALFYFLETDKYKREIEDYYNLSFVQSNIANVYIEKGEYENAEKYIKLGLTIAEKHDIKPQILFYYKTLLRLYRKQNIPEKSMLYFDKYLQLKEELDEKNFSDKIAEMQIKFETNLKEREAKILREKNIELEAKNKQIITQKEKIEKTLEELRQSEINFSYASKELKNKIGSSIVGQSKSIKKIINLITNVAKTKSTTVLITGESGTGKELIARAIHDFSDRKNASFCGVNVSAISESLFESEFFGHTKNAFTGANIDKPGWFEIANGGTLFLDEIGTLSPNLQTKLLRVLEERKIVRVGSHKEIPIDVRIISATNSNLLELAESKRFRFDLYHRLATFVINIPPLRERISDIPLLIKHFVNLFAKQMNKNFNRIEKKVETKLMSYDFPGNVRELKNMLERAIIMAKSSTLKLSDFNFPASVVAESNSCDGIVPLAELEKQMVLKALKKTNFHQANAAKLLGIKPKAIERRMLKYGIKKKI